MPPGSVVKCQSTPHSWPSFAMNLYMPQLTEICVPLLHGAHIAA